MEEIKSEAEPAESAAPELTAGVTIKEAVKVEEEDREKTPTAEPAVPEEKPKEEEKPKKKKKKKQPAVSFWFIVFNSEGLISADRLPATFIVQNPNLGPFDSHVYLWLLD